MPHMDGIEATRQIKALRPMTQVIVLTVHDDQELVQAADEAGAYCYLVKDCPPSLIGEAITQAWEFKQGTEGADRKRTVRSGWPAGLGGSFGRSPDAAGGVSLDHVC